MIKQTAGELSIDQQVNGLSNVVTLKLDGSESVNTGPRGGEIKSKARWDGGKLIVQSTQTMRTPNGEQTMQTTETRSLAETLGGRALGGVFLGRCGALCFHRDRDGRGLRVARRRHCRGAGLPVCELRRLERLRKLQGHRGR